jgi:hypothetical protein
MPPLHVPDILYCVASFLVGGALTWRVLGRVRRGHYRKLAQDLRDGVHDRCTAYQRLEDRIDAVIAGFDQRESEIRDGSSAGIHAAEMQAAEIPAPLMEAPEIQAPEMQAPEMQETLPPDAFASAAVAGSEPAAGSDALSWMDACDGAGQAISADAGETSFVGLPVAGEPAVDSTETVVDRFAQSLQVLQRQKSDELERQRAWTRALEGRIQALESSMRESAQRERAAQNSRRDAAESAPRAAATVAESSILEQSLQAIYERIARSEQEFAAWHAQYEELARERLAAIESAREIAVRIRPGVQRPPLAGTPATIARPRAEEPAREVAEPPPPIVRSEPIPRREKGPSRPILAFPRILAAMEARSRGIDPSLPRSLASEPPPEASRESTGGVRETPPRAFSETRMPAGEAAGSVAELDDVPGLLDARHVESGHAGAAELESPSPIAQVMKRLESARVEAEICRRRLHEQNTQFTAAYAMLDRIRPFVEALESEFAVRDHEVERRG